jgi:hypothetical protein
MKHREVIGKINGVEKYLLGEVIDGYDKATKQHKDIAYPEITVMYSKERGTYYTIDLNPADFDDLEALREYFPAVELL